MAHSRLSSDHTMRTNETEGSRVFIDGEVLAKVEETQPSGMSRTAWINYLIQLGAAKARAQLIDA